MHRTTLLIICVMVIWLFGIPKTIFAIDTNELRSEGIDTYAPGRDKAAAQQAERIKTNNVSQLNSTQAVMDTQNANQPNKENQKTDNKNETLDLQKKTGGVGNSKPLPDGGQLLRAPQGTVWVGLDYDIQIGTGEFQCWATPDQNGQIQVNVNGQSGAVEIANSYIGTKNGETDRLISEYINGVKHIYVGFNNVGITVSNLVYIEDPGAPGTYQWVSDITPIQTAADMAEEGDVVIIADGAYVGNLNLDTYDRIYGGYTEDGKREKWTFDNQTVGLSWIMGDITVRPANDASSDAFAEVNNFVLMGRVYSDNAEVLLGYPIFYSYSNGEYHIGAQNDGNHIWCYDPIQLTNLYIDGGTVDWGGAPDDRSVTNTDRDPEERYIAPAAAADEAGAGSNWNAYDYRNASNDSDYNYYDSMFADEVDALVDFNKLAQDGTLDSLFTNKYFLKKQKREEDMREAVARALKGSLNEFTIPEDLMRIEAAIGTNDRIILLRVIVETLKDKTGDQRSILEAAESVLTDVKMVEEGSRDEATTEAADEFARTVARVLLTQAIPDLMKEGDVVNLKNLFQDLVKAKDSLMERYNKAVEPYYSKIKEELVDNLAILQLNDIILKTITEKDLINLSPIDIDRIMERLKKASRRTAEEERILRQESQYRKKYVDPEKNVLRNEMKMMLKTFSRKMSSTLDLAQKKAGRK